MLGLFWASSWICRRLTRKSPQWISTSSFVKVAPKLQGVHWPWKSCKVFELEENSSRPGKALKISAGLWKSWNFFPAVLIIIPEHYSLFQWQFTMQWCYMIWCNHWAIDVTLWLQTIFIILMFVGMWEKTVVFGPSYCWLVTEKSWRFSRS